MSHSGVQQGNRDHVNGNEPRLMVEHTVDVVKHLVTVKFGKSLRFADIEKYTKFLQTDPSFRPTFSEIADLTEVEGVEVRSDEFLKLADESDPFSPDAKRAFVARTPVQHHAARMHRILRGQKNMEIFSTIEEAERWIKS